MRWIAIWCVLVSLICSAGCRASTDSARNVMSGLMFGLFGSHYSDGATWQEREYNYERQVEAWDKYEPESPTEAGR